MSNWDIGTLLIIIFAIVCVGLTALVISFAMAGKSKAEDETDTKPEDTNL